MLWSGGWPGVAQGYKIRVTRGYWQQSRRHTGANPNEYSIIPPKTVETKSKVANSITGYRPSVDGFQ